MLSLLRFTSPIRANVAKTLMATVAVSLSMNSIAADNSNNSATDDRSYSIDISQLSTTKEEVAVLQVLSEICPLMLSKQQQQSFLVAYDHELKNLMPTISEPRMAVQYLSSQQDYRQILNDTRQWTLSYPKADNKEVCLELANAQY